MGKRTIVELIDDLDQRTKSGVVTVVFSIEDEFYEIDLKPSNLKRLRQKLAPFVEVARKVAKSTAWNRNIAVGVTQRQEMRNMGIEVGLRGKIKDEALDQYRFQLAATNGHEANSDV